MPDWEFIIKRLSEYPPGCHRLLPPCPEERIRTIAAELGTLPPVVEAMLAHFNGCELFNRHGPLITIFGISLIPPMPESEWASDWYIDKFTRVWRSRGGCGPHDWVLAMTNYGGLAIYGEDRLVREWDTAQRMWGPTALDFDNWFDKVLTDGDAFLRE